MIVAVLVASLLAITSPPPVSAAGGTPDPLQFARGQFDAARKTLAANLRAVDTRSGLATTLEQRLKDDTPGLGQNAKPAWMAPADYADYETNLAKLDKSLVDQYASGSYHSLT